MSRPPPSRTQTTTGPASSAWQTAIPAALVLVSGLFAYWGAWRGQYVFDDVHAIAENRALLSGDWWQAAFGPQHQPLANRPLSCWSLTVDFALYGPGPLGPHATNVLLHLANALLVFVVARRCALAPNLAGRFTAGPATWFATSLAALWAAHPLGADAVAYATQRSTLLAAGSLLLALYGTLRAPAAPRPWRWRALAVVAMAAGMASKEDAVVGPLLLVLCERAFLLPSWPALRARAPFYAAIGLTWSVLAVSVALGPANATVGYRTNIPVSAWQWLLTQADVVLLYARLALWPYPLRGAYDHDIVTHVAAAALPGLAVLAACAGTVVCWRRRPWAGWLGAWYFLLLAPTSSVLPIVTEVVAERRAYLPMLAVLAPVVLAAQRVLGGRRPLAVLAPAAVVVALGLVTQTRVAVYHDAESFWRDADAKRDPASRSFVAGLILVKRGDTLWHAGRTAEAYACYDAMMLCRSPSPIAIGRYAMSLLDRQRPAEAAAVLRRLVRSDPDPETDGMLGIALSLWHSADQGRRDDPRLAEAEAALRRAVTAQPQKAHFWSALVEVLGKLGRHADAAAAAQQARQAAGR
jgi:tetratricopeptide (TPR) repeat protein